MLSHVQAIVHWTPWLSSHHDARAGMLGQPESPRWLVQKDRRQDAEESARRLWGTEGAAQLGETSTSGALPCLPCLS